MNNIISIENQHILKCSELYIEVFNAEPWNDKWTLETAHKRLNDIYISTNFEGVLYVEDEQIKGAIFGNYEQFYDGIHYNLREMFISNELQGQGIGSKLINELEKRLKGIGVTTIILFTSKENKTSEFYSKNNFTEWDSMAMMGKDL
ncbi:GNAT family N-acetyltransferase [Clostridium tagluense]|uniref:GNAT family N-acetyltransferase n=1 Tax=Clostridium tagluense TaxID=360422 RepID=UPI001CF1C43D|nr:GNAT family N-acetyltransferase [Clostridium tagluense]MCB2312953.1 GNAT family N-acetyltransferase [Clostridium tagluense]MCB2317719.1 GNAT family N-acetyltransferase [Clostridium tagluense]MCB2322446.1 GNAT family N-acetyltransferase [Clostridium tagluense]MCB2327449.1 GNAT family N-acetyltransferase [Clostridium tagluense]MCB2332168.1 GNAT family N-acetyltransferase [Clostridium tagluense]